MCIRVSTLALAAKARADASAALAKAQAEAKAASEAAAREAEAREAAAQAEAAALAAAYRNPQYEALEATLAATPLSRLDTVAVNQLRAGYVAVVDTETVAHPEIAEAATMRLRQLELAVDLNLARTDIEAARQRIQRSQEDLNAQLRRMDEAPDYALRGKLAVSPIFDGTEKPLLYRLQDPFSGRSLAYVSPDAAVDVRGMLGQRVGIVGSVTWDPNLGVMRITPERVDLVSVTPPS